MVYLVYLPLRLLVIIIEDICSILRRVFKLVLCNEILTSVFKPFLPSMFSLFKRPSVKLHSSMPYVSVDTARPEYNCFIVEGWQKRIPPLASVLITDHYLSILHFMLLPSIQSTLLLLFQEKSQMLQIVVCSHSVSVHYYIIICITTF